MLDGTMANLGNDCRENPAGNTDHNLEHRPYSHKPTDLVVSFPNGSKISCTVRARRELGLDESETISEQK